MVTKSFSFNSFLPSLSWMVIRWTLTPWSGLTSKWYESAFMYVFISYLVNQKFIQVSRYTSRVIAYICLFGYRIFYAILLLYPNQSFICSCILSFYVIISMQRFIALSVSFQLETFFCDLIEENTLSALSPGWCRICQVPQLPFPPWPWRFEAAGLSSFRQPESDKKSQFQIAIECHWRIEDWREHIPKKEIQVVQSNMFSVWNVFLLFWILQIQPSGSL